MKLSLYKPYNRKDSKPTTKTSYQPQQPWGQFSSRGRSLTSIFQGRPKGVKPLNDIYYKTDPVSQKKLSVLGLNQRWSTKCLTKGQNILVAMDNKTVVSYINKEGYEIRLTLCLSLETAPMLQPQVNSAGSQAHSRLFQCNS